MRSWLVEYRPKCGCTALKEPVDCGQGFLVYADDVGDMKNKTRYVDMVLEERDQLQERVVKLREALSWYLNSLEMPFDWYKVAESALAQDDEMEKE